MTTHRTSPSRRLASLLLATTAVLAVAIGASCRPQPIQKPPPKIQIESFAQGAWGDPPNVAGHVLYTKHPEQLWVVINGGMPFHPAPDGRFFAAWPAFANHLPFHTIVAELQGPAFETLDRDVRVAHHLTDFNAVPGPKDEPVAGGVRARLARGGYDELATLVADNLTSIQLPPPEPEVPDGPLATFFQNASTCVLQGVVAIALNALGIPIPVLPPPITFCFHGVNQEVQDVNFDGEASLTIEPRDRVGNAPDGLVRVEAVLPNVHADATTLFEFSFSALVFFDFACDVDITIDEATVAASFDLDPDAVDPHLVDVTQQDVDVTVTGFHADFGGLCGPMSQLLGLLGFQLGENAAVNAVLEKLENVPDEDDDPFLASQIEQAIADLAIQARLVEAFQETTGIPLVADAPISGITTTADGTDARFDVLVEVAEEAVDDDVQSEFLYPLPVAKVYPPVTPTLGAPYELAASIAVGSLNQALRAAHEAGTFTYELSEIDFHALGFDISNSATPDPNDVLEGPQPITAALLAVLFLQDFGALDPNLALEFRLEPTLAPVVTLPDPQPPLRTDPIEVSIGGLEVEIAEPNDGKVWLRMVAGFTAGIDINPGRTLGAISTHIDWPFAPPVLQSIVSVDQELGRWPDDEQSTCLVWLLLHAFVLPSIEKELVHINLPALVLPGSDTVYRPDLIEREVLNTDNTINFYLNFDTGFAGLPGIGTTPLSPPPPVMCPVTTVTLP